MLHALYCASWRDNSFPPFRLILGRGDILSQCDGACIPSIVTESVVGSHYSGFDVILCHPPLGLSPPVPSASQFTCARNDNFAVRDGMSALRQLAILAAHRLKEGGLFMAVHSSPPLLDRLTF